MHICKAPATNSQTNIFSCSMLVKLFLSQDEFGFTKSGEESCFMPVAGRGAVWDWQFYFWP